MEGSMLVAEVQEPWEILSAGLKAWEEFEPIDQERIVRHYAPRIRYVALRMKTRMPAHVDLGDLISAGTLGLLDALGKFRPDLAFRFETYADNRIRGAILDELRRLDWMPRKLRSRMRLLEEAIEEIESKSGRSATEEELQAATGLPEKEVREGLIAIQGNLCISLDLLPEPRTDSNAVVKNAPHDELMQKELIEKLLELIDHLSQREQTILSLYYAEGCNMREVAEILGLSEGRVSQLHTEALQNIRKEFLKRYGLDGLDAMLDHG